jgi:hypothetical protein
MSFEFPLLRPDGLEWARDNTKLKTHDSRLKTENSKLQKVFARYELSTTVIELNGIRMAARRGLMWPVMAKLTATTL